MSVSNLRDFLKLAQPRVSIERVTRQSSLICAARALSFIFFFGRFSVIALFPGPR